MRRSLLLSALLSLLANGCASSRAITLVNITERGPHSQWVYPYFLTEQPTVLAFWNTNEMECQRNVPSLQALDARGSSVQLVTVATGRDRLEISKWLQEKRIRYAVLLDLDEDLAKRLDVSSYPTFIAFNTEGEEVERVDDIRLVRKFFDSDRWYQTDPGARTAPASAAIAE